MRLAISLVLLTGCLLPHASDDGVDPSNPGPNPQPVAAASGTYQVRSQIDITIEALLPEPAEQVVVTLRNFSTEPAHTLITLADAAGVPAISELRSVLPDVLESRLEGWIDDEIAKVKLDGVPITQIAGEVAALAETTLTQVGLDSTLEIAGATATHRLTTLDFAPAGLAVQLPLESLPGDLIHATATASSRNGALALGDHRFALPYGEYAWRALDTVCVATYGADIRATLGAAINCPAIASRIASKCVLGVCVGHTSALTSLCERGLDEVVSRVHAKFAELRFDAIHFAAGTAQIAGGGATLDHGQWTAEINAGMGLRPVPATFTAAR
jgi:hypothetical protein